MVYLYLMIAIIAEVAGTLALKPAEGFTPKVLPNWGPVYWWSWGMRYHFICCR